MKKAVFFLFYMFLIVSCNKDDDGCRGVDCLPPKTQTGENTFGCLLDGKPFILKGGVNPLDCVYQLIDGKWYFQLQGNNEDENFLGRAIIINTIDKETPFKQQTGPAIRGENKMIKKHLEFPSLNSYSCMQKRCFYLLTQSTFFLFNQG